MNDLERMLLKALFAKHMEEQIKEKPCSTPRMVGIFPIVSPSLSPGVPFDLRVIGDEPTPVLVEDEDFWQRIDQRQIDFRYGDALIAELVWDSRLRIMKAVSVKGVVNLTK